MNAEVNCKRSKSDGSYESEYNYESESEDFFDYDEEVAQRSVSQYRLSNIDEMGGMVESTGTEIAVLLNVSLDDAIALLIKSKWSKEKLLSEYYNNEGVGTCSRSSSDSSSSFRGNESDTGTCPICCDNFFANEMYGLECGHLCCVDCWDGHLTSKVSDGPSCVYTLCPMFKCDKTVPYSFFQQLISNQEVKNKYKGYVLKNFIENHHDIRHCPAPNCQKVVVRQAGAALTTINCECSHPFCFQCGEEVHDPVNCIQLQEWNMKNKSDSLTATWIIANTKNCPACKVRIEKNQGCMHMTCKSCNYNFCWTCLGMYCNHI